MSADIWLRVLMYAILGCLLEIIFTGVMDLVYPKFLCSWNTRRKEVPIAQKPDWAVSGRDSRAVAYTFFWMLPIYAMMIFLEPIHDYMRAQAWPWPFRGIVYVLLIWLAEFVTGAIVKKISGRCPWDYRYSKYALQGYIRWDFAPVWFGFGFIFEYFHDKFILLTPVFKQIFFNA